MAEVLYGWRGSIRGGDVCRRAVAPFDLRDQCLRDCVLRGSYPVFDLPVFFRRLSYDDIHAILQVKSVGGGDRGGGKNHARDKNASTLSQSAHFAPQTIPEP